MHPDIGPGAGFKPYDRKPRPLALEAPGKPSKWITLTALRVLKRVEDVSWRGFAADDTRDFRRTSARN